MDIEYLNEFRILANSSSFSEAAQKLFIAQPTLSRHIESLEAELGVQLFTRTTKELRITHDGIRLLKYANQLNTLKSSFMTKITPNHGERFNVIIGCDKRMANYGISQFLERFITNNPQYKISVIAENSSNLYRKLKNGSIDAAIIYSIDELNYPDYRVHELSKDYLAVMFSKNHPMATKESVALLDLKNEIFANSISAADFLATCNKACKNAGFLPQTAYEGILDRSIVFNLIKEQRCISFCWKISTENSLGGEFGIVKISPPITTKILFVSGKLPGMATPTLDILLHSLKDYLRRNPING